MILESIDSLDYAIPKSIGFTLIARQKLEAYWNKTVNSILVITTIAKFFAINSLNF